MSSKLVGYRGSLSTDHPDLRASGYERRGPVARANRRVGELASGRARSHSVTKLQSDIEASVRRVVLIATAWRAPSRHTRSPMSSRSPWVTHAALRVAGGGFGGR